MEALFSAASPHRGLRSPQFHIWSRLAPTHLKELNDRSPLPKRQNYLELTQN